MNKKTTTQKLFALLLALIMVLGIMPVTAFAAAGDSVNVWVGGVKMKEGYYLPAGNDKTAEDLTNTEPTGGYAYMKDATTLVLSNYSYTGDGIDIYSLKAGILSRLQGTLTIELAGKNTINANYKGILAERDNVNDVCSLVIKSAGFASLDVTAQYAAIKSQTDLTIKDCIVNAKSTSTSSIDVGVRGIIVREELNIENSNVKASGMCGIDKMNHGHINVKDSEVTVTGVERALIGMLNATNFSGFTYDFVIKAGDTAETAKQLTQAEIDGFWDTKAHKYIQITHNKVDEITVTGVKAPKVGDAIDFNWNIPTTAEYEKHNFVNGDDVYTCAWVRTTEVPASVSDINNGTWSKPTDTTPNFDKFEAGYYYTFFAMLQEKDANKAIIAEDTAATLNGETAVVKPGTDYDVVYYTFNKLEAADSGVINSVEVSGVQVPKVGEKMDWTAPVIPEGAHYESYGNYFAWVESDYEVNDYSDFYDFEEDGWKTDCVWYYSGDGEYTFKEGKYYTLCIYLDPVDDNYHFATVDEVSAEINDEEAGFTKMDVDDAYTLFRTFGPLKAETAEEPAPSASIVKEEISTPKNGKFYIEGEKITYKITVTNTGNTTLYEYFIYDSLIKDPTFWIVSGAYIDCEADCDGEETNVREHTYEHTVTKDDVKAGLVSNYAWLTYNVYDNGDLIDTGLAISRTVTSKTGSEENRPLPRPSLDNKPTGEHNPSTGAPAVSNVLVLIAAMGALTVVCNKCKHSK